MTSRGLENQIVARAESNKAKASPEPPVLFEYTFYALIVYATLGEAWGLAVPALGGAMFAVLAAACLMTLGSRALEVYAPIAFALSCGISVIVVQLALHDTDPLGETRPFIDWLLTLAIVQALSLRQGFLHRFAFAAFGMGVCTLPFVKLGDSGDIMRAGAYGTGISNPNALALWFGFCCVYFLVFGFETKRVVARAASWFIAFGCLYVVGITVSRGPLVAVAVASIVALRRTLKDSFKPLLFFVIFSWIVYESGVFDQVTNYYFARGMEETGRGIIWPLAFQRFLNSPWEGVGLAEIYTFVGSRVNSPHNGVLFIALSSGAIPAAFFLVYLLRAASGVFHSDPQQFPAAQYLLPLVTFALLEIMILDAAFMSPWSVVVLSLSASRFGPPRRHQTALSQMRRASTEQVCNTRDRNVKANVEMLVTPTALRPLSRQPC
jgi:hypothetical protein